MIKKRIKRALRAMGLVGPVPGSLAAKRALPNQAQARVIATDIYQLILKRTPDAKEHDSLTKRLASGKASEVDAVRELMESEEFGKVFSRHAVVAASLSNSILGSLAGITDGKAIAAYANGFVGAMSVADVIGEICGSPDFQQLWSIAPGTVPTRPAANRIGVTALSGSSSAAYSEIGHMVEGLIAGRLIREGAVLGLPPIDAAAQTPVSGGQLVSLIQTLDMLADRPAAR